MDENKDKNLLIQLFIIAIPIAIQNLINVGVSVTDTSDDWKIDELQLAGISQANQPYFYFYHFNIWISIRIYGFKFSIKERYQINKNYNGVDDEDCNCWRINSIFGSTHFSKRGCISFY